MKYYVSRDLNDPSKLKVERRTNPPENSLGLAPIDSETGLPEIIESLEIQIIDGVDTVVVNESKKTQGIADRAQVEIDMKYNKMRQKRDDLLAETDYIMTSDYPLADKSSYETYRQELRDLPDNIVDIDNFSFPVKPQE